MRALQIFRLSFSSKPSPLVHNVGIPVRSTLCTASADRVSEVIVADPRKILESRSEGGGLQITVPLSFLPQLSSPKFELGEADDPMSSYIFGKRREIFQYNFAGTVSTQSGWVSLITKQSLKALQPNAVDWKALQSAAEEGGGILKGSKPGQPFLFAGQILEAPAVGVYISHYGADLDGIMITTSDDEISTP